MSIEQFIVGLLREAAFLAIMTGTAQQSAAGARFLRESQRVVTS